MIKDIRWVNREIRKIEPQLKRNTSEFLAYQVLLSALIAGNRQQQILRFMNTRRWREVVGLVRICKKEKVFVGEKFCSEIYADGVGLALGAGLLLGLFKRTPVEKAA